MASATYTAASVALNIVPDLSGFFSDIDSRIRGYDPPPIRPRVEPDVDTDAAEDDLELSASSGGLAAAAVAAGLAIGAALAAGIGSALEKGALQDKLAAQLGGSNPQFAADMGRIAGELYANAYGDSLESVNDALRSVLQSGALSEDATDEQIKGVTASVLDLSQTFGVDASGAANALGQMIRTGMAPNAEAGLDIITRGFQQGADKAEDFLDTLNEYSTQFRKLGLDGAGATGLITQGLQGGARDADLVADSLKEFSIRAIDGSDSTKDAYDKLGLSAKKMTDDIAAGGPTAAGGLDTVLDKLRDVQDPAERARLATELFGTQAEDLGDALYALDPSSAVSALGDVEGAAQQMGATVSDNATTKIESFKRTLETGFTDFLNANVIPAVEGFLDVMNGFLDIPGVPDILSFLFTSGAGVAIAIGLVTGAVKLWSLAQAAWNVVANANPMMLIVAAIGFLVGAAIWAYNNIEWFRDGVDAAFRWVADTATWVWENVLRPTFDWIGSAFSDVGDFFVWVFDNIIKPAFDGFSSFLDDLVDGLGVIWDGIKKIFGTPVYFVLETVWNNGIGGLWEGAKNLGIPLGDFPKADTSGIPHFAEGGAISGSSPHKRADNLLIRATAGEYILPVDAVDYYGADNLDMLRRRAIAKEALPGFAYGGVLPRVAAAGDEITSLFGPMPGGIGGVGYRANASDHPLGLALDFMTLADRALGDRVAGHLMANANRLAVKYLIWRQRINEGSGWKQMADRGSITANHFDHVHASFLRMMGVGPGGFAGTNEGFSLTDGLKGIFDGAVSALRGLVPAKNGTLIGDLPMGMFDAVTKNIGDFLFSRAREEDAKHSYTGASVDQWIPVVQQALNMLGLGRENIGWTLDRMMQESGGNPRAINLDDANARRGDPSKGLMQVIGCVPHSTRILTRRGWLRHDEVRVGDETLGYNPGTGRSEWTQVTAVYHYADRTVRRIGHSRWHADVTDEHRWWSDTVRYVASGADYCTACDRRFKSLRGCQIHMAKIHGLYQPREHVHVGEFVRTADLRSANRIRLAAPADTDGIAGLSLQDCAVVAWLQGDGHIRKAEHGRGWDGVISQSKPQMVVKLRALLADIPHSEASHVPTGYGVMPTCTFRLRRSYVTELFKRAELDVDPKGDTGRFVLELSPDQRAAWLAAMIDAEGSRRPLADGSEHVRIAQNVGPVLDAIRVAVYLEGWAPSLVAQTVAGLPTASVSVGMCRPHVTPRNFTDPRDLGRQDVWCVTTRLGTWTMEQDGQVMLTGNSTFERFWDPRTPKDVYNPLSNIVASMRYAINRYGSLYTAYTKSGGYDEGGALMPGLTPVFNGLGHQETVIPLPPDLVANLLRQGRGGGAPAVAIENATFADPVNVDVLMQRADHLVRAGRL